jgi:transcriptional regulator with XRE-family HTH domain
MHEFYARVQEIFRQAGSNRSRFCRKHGYNYQTLQAYWNTDRLPPGNVLEDIARDYDVSLDSLVLGRTSPGIDVRDAALAGIVRFLRQLDPRSLPQVEGALKMFRYLSLTSQDPGGTARRGTAPAADLDPAAPLIPDKTEKALSLLSELSLRLKQGSMGREDKAACRAIIGQVVQNLYEREVKDEWAELEEAP